MVDLEKRYVEVANEELMALFLDECEAQGLCWGGYGSIPIRGFVGWLPYLYVKDEEVWQSIDPITSRFVPLTLEDFKPSAIQTPHQSVPAYTKEMFDLGIKPTAGLLCNVNESEAIIRYYGETNAVVMDTFTDVEIAVSLSAIEPIRGVNYETALKTYTPVKGKNSGMEKVTANGEISYDYTEKTYIVKDETYADIVGKSKYPLCALAMLEAYGKEYL